VNGPGGGHGSVPENMSQHRPHGPFGYYTGSPPGWWNWDSINITSPLLSGALYRCGQELMLLVK
jgi:hypothetical protein